MFAVMRQFAQGAPKCSGIEWSRPGNTALRFRADAWLGNLGFSEIRITLESLVVFEVAFD